MQKLHENTFIVTDKELRSLKASSFEDKTVIYIRNNKNSDPKYIINLEKGVYKSFGLKSTVQNAATFKFLSCTTGVRGGWPYYITDFITR